MIRQLDTLSEADIAGLADVLVDCIDGGASVSFMLPLSHERACTFWQGLAEDVAQGRRLLFVARYTAGIVGTVQVILSQPENQPHRADLAKMLVHRRGRRGGLGAALIRAAEDGARAAGKTLLVLDTATGSDAERLYERLGWQRAGVILRAVAAGRALRHDGLLSPSRLIAWIPGRSRLLC